MSGIFISYRRSDGAAEAHWLYDWLRNAFEDTDVFIDVESMAPSWDFAQVIDEKVGFCDALIAVIGRSWLSTRDRRGQRRLDDPDDWVRLEISAALRRGIPVIPVLVDGARMPESTELPRPLATLSGLQALPMRADASDSELAGLRGVLEKVGRKPNGVGLWLQVLTRGHRALDPLELDDPEVVLRSLRFLACMILLSDLLRLPMLLGTGAVTNLGSFTTYLVANYFEWLGAGVALHLALRLFGGRGTLQKSIAAFCLMSAYVPLISLAQVPVWSLHVDAFRALDGGLTAVLAVLEGFVEQQGGWGNLRLAASFLLSTTLWIMLMRSVLAAFRTLQRVGLARCALAALTALLGYLIFLSVFYGSLISQVYAVFDGQG